MSTFGETTTGDGDITLNYNGMMGGSGALFTSPNDAGTLIKGSVYVRSPVDSKQGKFVLYSISGGAPNAKLASSEAQVLVADAWNHFAMNYALAPNTLYALQLSIDVQPVYLRRQTYAGSKINRMSTTFCSEANTYSDNPIADYHICIYATYTPVGVEVKPGASSIVALMRGMGLI